MHATMEKDPTYGMLAEFESPEELLAAARKTREHGYTRLDAYSPLPIEGLAEAIGHHRNLLPKLVLAAGVIGALTGFGMQYFISVIDYPVNVGGRPFNSWPSFIPVTFEMTVLFAAFAATFGMIALNGLPRPHHPVFNEPRFALVTSNRFFLCVEAEDPRYHPQETRRFLEQLHPCGIYEVRDE